MRGLSFSGYGRKHVTVEDSSNYRSSSAVPLPKLSACSCMHVSNEACLPWFAHMWKTHLL